MEAATVIELDTALRNKLPNSKLSWRPSNDGTKYRCNVEFDECGNIETLVNFIAQYCSEQQTIVLTVHNNYVYFN